MNKKRLSDVLKRVSAGAAYVNKRAAKFIIGVEVQAQMKKRALFFKFVGCVIIGVAACVCVSVGMQRFSLIALPLELVGIILGLVLVAIGHAAFKFAQNAERKLTTLTGIARSIAKPLGYGLFQGTFIQYMPSLERWLQQKIEKWMLHVLANLVSKNRLGAFTRERNDASFDN